MNAAESIELGRSARAEGDRNTARARYSQAAEIYQQQGNRLAYAHTIRHIADTYLDELEFELARPLYEEALEIYGVTSIRDFLIWQIRYDLTPS